MDKVKLPKEISNQIEALRKCGYNNQSILNFIEKNGVQGAVFKNWISEETVEPNGRFDIFLQALVNGYEVEETHEDKVRKLFNGKREGYDVGEVCAYRRGVGDVLDTLNIKIEGVNA